MVLADLDHSGGESADHCRAHHDCWGEYRRIEEGIDRKVGELFHAFIVNELRAWFDEVCRCFESGVIPTRASADFVSLCELTRSRNSYGPEWVKRAPRQDRFTSRR